MFASIISQRPYFLIAIQKNCLSFLFSDSYLTSLDFANFPDSEVNIYTIFTPRLRPTYIPFRESKLTRLFQPFFCGKGKACMIVNVSQCASTYDETLHVMKFSAVAKQVRKMLYPSQYSEHITYLILPLLP